MTTKAPMPKIADIKNFPRDNPKAILLRLFNKIRVVERQYYWDKEKCRGLEKRLYLGYVVDNEFLTNEEYQRKYNKRGRARIESSGLSVATYSSVVDTDANMEKNSATSFNEPLSTVLAGELPLYYAVAKDIGLIDDLSAVWGEDLAGVMLSLAFHWLSTEQNACYLYNSWADGRLLPYPDSLKNEEIGDLLKQISDQIGWKEDFFQARIKRLHDDELLAFDVSEIASNAQDIADAQYGQGKDGGYQKQVGLILLVGRKTLMPVLFRVLPGSITDITRVPELLFHFDEIKEPHRVFATLLNSDYLATEKLASFIDHGSRVIIQAQGNVSWIKLAIKDILPKLRMSSSRIADTNLWATTIPIERKFEDGKIRKLWLHVYRSDMRSHYENADFFGDLDKFAREWINWEGETPSLCPLHKSPLRKYFKKDIGVPGISPLEQDSNAIDDVACFFGTFSNVTTMDCSAKDALLDYQAFDLIEKCFKADKSGFCKDVISAHREKSMEGRLVISFIAMSILSSIHFRMKQNTKSKVNGLDKEEHPLSEETSFNEIKNRLSTARLVIDGKGKKLWMGISKDQHEIARRLGFPNLYITIPTWGSCC